MTEQDDALRVSAALDDGVGELETRFAGHGRVHAALSARGAAPMERPALDAHARVMVRIGVTGTGRSLWPLAIAASLTVLGGVGWVLTHRAAPAPQTGPRIAESASSTFADFMKPLVSSDAAVQASVEGPFLREARLIREDTRQGMEIVLARLPVGRGGFK
jgi:hypothetical protein